MVTKESLEVQYANLETNDLLVIISHDSGYTELAMSVAIDELKRREVAVDVIEKYKEVDSYVPEPILLENYLIDLSFTEKFTFYLFWFIFIMRFRRYIKITYREEGYILKSNQMRYYAITGFIFSIVAMASSNYIGNGAWLVYIACFLPAHLFDSGFNKQRQVNKLESIMESGGDFEWD